MFNEVIKEIFNRYLFTKGTEKTSFSAEENKLQLPESYLYETWYICFSEDEGHGVN